MKKVKSILAVKLAALLCACGFAFSAWADAGAALTPSGTTITPAAFKTAVDGVATYDGQGVTVDFSEESGDNNHSDGKQFYVLGGYDPMRSQPITVRNVKFYSSSDKAQLYLYTKANVTFENCVFENVGVSMHGVAYDSKATALGTFTNCTFKDFDEYAIKYVYNVVVSGCRFDNCERALLIGYQPKAPETPVEVSKVIIDGCEFSNLKAKRIVKFYDIEPVWDENTVTSMMSITNNKVEDSCTAGFIQIEYDTVNGGASLSASNYTYRFYFVGNTGITQVNVNDVANTKKPLYIDGDYLVDVEPVAVTYVAQIGANKYETLAAAISAAVDGDTIELLSNVTWDGTGSYYWLKAAGSVTIDGKGYTLSAPAAGGPTDSAIMLGDSSNGTTLNVYTITNMTFSGFSGNDHSVIRCQAVTANIVDCTFVDNTIAGSKWGIVTGERGVSLNVKNCVFRDNDIATKCIDFGFNNTNGNPEGTMVVDGCVFENNTISDSGVVYVAPNTVSAVIQNSTFSGNEINASGAAVVYCSNPATIAGNLFTNNTVTVTGSGNKCGVLALGSGATNSVFTGNAFDSNTVTYNDGNKATIYVGANNVDLAGNYWGGSAPTVGDGSDIYVASGKSATYATYATAYTTNANGRGVTVVLPPANHTVTFDLNAVIAEPTRASYYGGLGPDSNVFTQINLSTDPTTRYAYTVTVVEGETVSKPFNSNGLQVFPARRDGYIFDGWQLNGVDYDFTTPVTSDITLTAKWKAYTDSSITIADAEEFLAYATMFSAASISFSGVTVTLTDDIAFTETLRPWNPLTGFSGTLNGGNHKITGLNIVNVDASKKWVGLFYQLTSGSISNLTIESPTVTSAGEFVGVLAGTSAIPLSNVRVTGDISVTGKNNVGGLVGGAGNGASFANCAVNGSNASSISATDTDGRIVGGVIGSTENYKTGDGFITMNDCSVSGVTISGYRKLGGLIGQVQGKLTCVDAVVSNVVVHSNADTSYNDKLTMGGMVGIYANSTTYSVGSSLSGVVSDINMEGPDSALTSGKSYVMGLVSGGTGADVTSAESTMRSAGLSFSVKVKGTNLLDYPNDSIYAGINGGVPAVAQIGETQYETLAAAIVAAQDGDTIELLADIELAEAVVHNDKNGTFTLDGNGHTISQASGASFGGHGALDLGTGGGGSAETIAAKSYTITDVVFTGFTAEIIRAEGCTVTLDNCTFTENIVTVDTAGRGTHAVIFSHAAATVRNCTFTNNGGDDGAGRLIDFNSQASVNAGNGTLLVEGCLFSNNKCADNGIIFSNGCASRDGVIRNSTFTGNTITEGSSAVIYLSGQTTISGCCFDGNTIANATSKGGIVLLGSKAGGTVINGNAFLSNNAFGTSTKYGTVFSGSNCDADGNYWGDGAAPEVGTTNGNDVYLKDSPTVTASTYAESYAVNDNGRGVTVTLYVPPVAQIGETKYTTLAAAIAAAQAGNTIEVFEGTVEISNNVVIPEGVTIKGEGAEKTTAVVIASASGDGVKVTNPNVTISNMTIDGSAITSGGYNSIINVEADGVVIDGVVMKNGGTSTWNSSILVEKIGSSATFTVKNSTISGSFRGVLRESCNANIVIDNCDIDAVYPFNIDGGNGGTVTVKDSSLHGWTSYSGIDSVTFTNCKFSKANSGYDVVAAYVNTTFTDCEFDSSFNIYAQTSPFTFSIIDCTKDETVLTWSNFKEKFPNDPDVWNKCTCLVNGINVNSVAVAQIGETKYPSLAAAIAAVPANGETATTITMVADETFDKEETLSISDNKNIVLNLNGKTISGSSDLSTANFYFIQVNTGCSLTVKDGSEGAAGKISFASSVKNFSYERVTVKNIGGTLTLESGTIENVTGGGMAYAVNNAVNWGHTSTFNMTGGTLSSVNGDGDLRIYNNTAVGVSSPSRNTVNISGGTLASTGIFCDVYLGGNIPANYTGENVSTTLNITGGTINGLVDFKIRHKYNNNFTISGGDFTNAKLRVRKYTSEYNGDEPTEPMVTITGGKFAFVDDVSAFNTSSAWTMTSSWTSYKPYTVTGGVFNVDLNNYAGIAFESGKMGVSNTDEETKTQYPYTVGDAIAMIGDNTYETLEGAVAAVANGQTIKMLADAYETVTVNSGNTITIDLNGKTVTGGLKVYSGFVTLADTASKKGKLAGSVNVYATTEGEGYNSFTLAEGAVIDAHYGIILREAAGKTGYGTTINVAGTVKGNVWVMGNIEQGNSVINVTGTVDATDQSDVGIALCGNVTLNVKDGAYITSKSATSNRGTGIEVRAGTLNVTGGEIVGQGAPVYSQGNDNGTTSQAAGVAVSSYNISNLAVNISGGSVSGYAPLYFVNSKGNTTALTLSVSDGTFTTTNGGEKAVVLDANNPENRAVSFISGGDFSKRVEEKYCAEDNLCTRMPLAGGYYSVVEKLSATFALGEAPDGAMVPATIYFAKGDLIATELPQPTYSSTTSTFAGWLAQGATTPIKALPSGTDANVTLTAKWTTVQTIEVATTTESQASTVDIKVTQQWIKDNVGETATTDEIVTALETKDTNQLPKWVNYVLGQDTAKSAEVTATKNNEVETVAELDLTFDTPVQDTGFNVTYRMDKTDAATGHKTEAESATATPTIDLKEVDDGAAYFEVVAVLTSKSGENKTVEVPVQKTVGVVKVESSAEWTIVAVPWESLGDGDIKASELIHLGNRSNGDELRVYKDGTYQTYVLEDGVWTSDAAQFTANEQANQQEETPVEADVVTIPRGAGVWLKRVDPTAPIYLLGQKPTEPSQASETVKTTLEPAASATEPTWNLLASPALEPVKISDVVPEGSTGDAILIPSETIPKKYTYEEGKGWGYEGVVETYTFWVNGVQVSVPEVGHVVDTDAKLPAAKGFWYINSSTDGNRQIDWEHKDSQQ